MEDIALVTMFNEELHFDGPSLCGEKYKEIIEHLKRRGYTTKKLDLHNSISTLI